MPAKLRQELVAFFILFHHSKMMLDFEYYRRDSFLSCELFYSRNTWKMNILLQKSKSIDFISTTNLEDAYSTHIVQ